MKINFISSKKKSDETHNMSTKSNNIEVMMGSEKDEVIEDLFKSLLQRFQEKLEEPVRGSDFIFGSIDELYYDLHKISLNRGGSYIDSPKWLKDKKATVNPKNNDDNCFQYAITAALNHEQIKKDPQRITEIKPFIDKYNWKEIGFPSQRKTGKSLNQIIKQ